MNGDFDIRLCMENGERLARIEESLAYIKESLANPCDRCQNKDELTRQAAELRHAKWTARIALTTMVTGLLGWFTIK